MPGRFTVLEVRDPRLIAPTAWESLPPWEKAVIDRRGFVSSRDWAPVDQRRFGIEPENYRTQYAIANIGRLRAHRIVDSLAMQFTIRLPTVDVVRIVIFERGGALLPSPVRTSRQLLTPLWARPTATNPVFRPSPATTTAG
jgi:hypothetical protein